MQKSNYFFTFCQVEEKRAQMSQLEKDIKKCEDLLIEKEDALEVADVDFSTSENLREDIVIVDRLHAEVVVISRRIDELTRQVKSKWMFLLIYS
jgi:hypothetical protein